MSSPYAQPSGKTLNPNQPLNPVVTPQPSTLLTQSQGGLLPPNSSTPSSSPYTTTPTTTTPSTTSASAPKLYAPTGGSSPYTTTPTVTPTTPSTPAPAPIPIAPQQPKLYQPTGESPYSISQPVTQSQALAVVAANNPSMVPLATSTFYPENGNNVTIIRNQEGFTVFETPQTKASDPLNISNLSPSKIVTNPIGFATSLLSLFGFAANQASAKSKGANPIESGFITGANILYGAQSWGGNTVNTIKNDTLGVVGVNPSANPFPIYNSKQQIGATVAPWVTAAALAPVTGGMSLVWGAANVGIDEALNFAPKIPIINPSPSGKLNTNPQTIGNEFLTGQVAAGVLQGVSPYAGRAISNLADRDIPVLSRGAQILETTGQKVTDFGAGIGNKVPLPKIGSADVPFTTTFEGEEYSGTATMKGLFLQQGPNARPLITSWSNLPDEEAMVKPTVGETPGYRPQTPIEAESTRQFMLKTGTPEETIKLNREVVNITNTVKGVKNPKLFDDFLPSATKTSNVEEVSSLKNYVIQNNDVVEKVFGKFGAISQENPEFTNEMVNPQTGKLVSSARVTSDIDIQLKPGITKEQAINFAQGVKDLYGPESGATLKPGSTLVETTPVELRGTGTNTLAHAVDIHSDYDATLNPNAGQPGTEMAWGVKISEKPRLIENVPTSKLTEQVAGKMQSVLDITDEGGFSPVPHRYAKDIVDYLTDAKTLNEQLANPMTQTRVSGQLQDVADYFNIGSINELPTNPEEEYVLTRPSIPSTGNPSQIATMGGSLFSSPLTSTARTSKSPSPFSSTFSSARSLSSFPSRNITSPSSVISRISTTPSILRLPSGGRSPKKSKNPFPTSRIPTVTPISGPSPKGGYYRIPTTPNSIPTYPPPSDITKRSSNKSNLPNLPGSKFETPPFVSPFSIPTGIDSRKQVFPILSGEDVLRI